MSTITLFLVILAALTVSDGLKYIAYSIYLKYKINQANRFADSLLDKLNELRDYVPEDQDKEETTTRH